MSSLEDTAKAIEIDTASLIVEEDTYVSVTKAGYIKRTSPRSFAASTLEEIGKRDDDRLIFCSICQDNPASFDVHDSWKCHLSTNP